MFSLVAVSLLLAATGDAIVIRALSSPRDVEVRLKLDPTMIARLLDANRDLREVFTLTIASDDGKPGLPIFANCTLHGDTLILRPRYRLSAEVTYVASARLPDGTSVQRRYRVPSSPAGPAPRVQRIFPSNSTLPANCLKFYIHFTQPMRQGRAIFEHIQLADDDGNVVHDPWRRTELWNVEGDRLTLWIHPGRIKKGVNLREEFGPVLKPNRAYRLLVTDQVRDLAGVPLAKPYVKAFVTGPEDHRRPDLRRWKLNQVRVGTRDPLIAVLDEPLDRALLTRFLRVTTAAARVQGSTVIGVAESTWTFTPDQPWSDDQVMLAVNGRLEDLAGNTPIRLFDTDLTLEPLVKPTLQLPITMLPQR